MINENMVLNHLRTRLGDILFKAVEPRYYTDVINEQSLLTWGIAFPQIVRGIIMTQRDVIPTVHPQSGQRLAYKYRLPDIRVNGQKCQWINVEQFLYPPNNTYSQQASGIPILNGAMNMVSSALPGAEYVGMTRFTCIFSPPNMVEISPPPIGGHVDFSLMMQRVPTLTEVPLYYRELFLELVLADVKIAMHHKYKHLTGTTSFQGSEVNVDALLEDLKDGESERKDVLTRIDKEYWKNPLRFQTLLDHM